MKTKILLPAVFFALIMLFLIAARSHSASAPLPKATEEMAKKLKLERSVFANIEKELGQLGAQTFSIQKFPPIFVHGREGWEKIWRRQNITMQQVQLLKEKASLAQSVAVEAYLARDAVASFQTTRHSACFGTSMSTARLCLALPRAIQGSKESGFALASSQYVFKRLTTAESSSTACGFTR